MRREFYLRWLKLKANVIELPLGVSHPQHQIDRPLVFRNVLLISKNLNNVHHTLIASKKGLLSKFFILSQVLRKIPFVWRCD